MHSWLSHFKSFLFTPTVSRLMFDIAAMTFLTVAIGLLFRVFSVASYSWLDGAIFALTVITAQDLIGIYQRLALARLRYKVIAIIAAHLLGVLAVLVSQPLSLGLVVLSTVSAMVMIFPRLLFNASFLRRNYLPAAFSTEFDPHQPILVVGGGGYIGSHVVAQLLELGHRVRVLDTFTYGRESLAELESNPNLEVQVGDVTDIFQLTSAVKEVKAVVHLAGIVGDPACALDEQLTKHVNIVSTRMLKEAVKAFRVPRFIFASSCSVYGANDERVDEHSDLNPVSLYARTKIDSEQEIMGDLYDAFHPTILRFATVFGHSRRMRFDLVANLFTAQAYYNGEIQVSGGDQWRPFVHVSDVARAIVAALEAPLPTVSRQIFNVGGDNLNATIEHIAEYVQKVVKTKKGRKSVKVIHKPFVSDRRNYHVSFKKIRTQLGFVPQYDLTSGIEEMYQNLQAGTYKKPYTDFVYSNVEMTRMVKEQFTSPDYRETHFSALSLRDAAVA